MARKERDNRVGVIVDVEHPGDNRRNRRLRGVIGNPRRLKREAARAAALAEANRIAAEATEAARNEALDKADES
jgi:AMMECR1 domain-containing protein